MTPRTFEIGDVRVHLVSDGLIRTDGGGAFGVVPRVLWQRIVEPDELNRIPMEIRSLLIETRAGNKPRLILVDTGYGDKLPAKRREYLDLQGERRLVSDLARLDFEPTDVDMVINTHLHDDHCGGNTRFADNGQLVPTFPSATYMVQRLELADATFPNERTRNTYFVENLLPLTESSRFDYPADADHYGDSVGQQRGMLHVLSGDTQITPEVRTLITPGHTRAHQAVIIESRGETAIFMADAAAWPVSLERLAWVPAYDVEPLISIETKRALRDWAYRQDALLFFQHDVACAAGKLCREGDKWRVEPEEER